MRKMNGVINGMKAIGPMIKTGMIAIGPQMNYTTRMNMVISRRYEKEGNARKARMMQEKEANQEMAKVSPAMCNLNNHRLLPYRIRHNNKLSTL